MTTIFLILFSLFTERNYIPCPGHGFYYSFHWQHNTPDGKIFGGVAEPHSGDITINGMPYWEGKTITWWQQTSRPCKVEVYELEETP